MEERTDHSEGEKEEASKSYPEFHKKKDMEQQSFH